MNVNIPAVVGDRASAASLDECRIELDVVRASVEHLSGVIDALDTGLQASHRAGIALGILMGRHGITECEAKAMLDTSAARDSLTPPAAADAITRTGALPIG